MILVPDMSDNWQNRIESFPLLRPVLEYLYERRFSGDAYGTFRGVFPDFESARRSAPQNKRVGFSSEGWGQEFADRRSRIFSFDYPVLFWLAPLLRTPIKLFDYGGHVGTHFYAYAHYAPYSQELRWQVCDLPEITRSGEKLAQEHAATALSFTNRFEDAEGAEVLLAAGSLQYVESPAFAVSLSRLKTIPTHILVNKVPLHEGPGFVTLQNGGVSFVPMYVFNRQKFVHSVCTLGYEVVDDWTVPSHHGRIPFHPKESFGAHSGIYFRRQT